MESPDGGEKFGKYLLRRRIAVGGMAELWLGERIQESGRSRPVAIKCVLPHLAHSERFVEMFLEEARIATLLDHPNVTEVLDFGRVDESYYLAMEYLVGEDLRGLQKLARQRKEWPIDASMVCQIIVLACEGLHHAHNLIDHGGRPLELVHRDVSPANIFVTYGGRVKVLDFGIAKARGALTPPTRVGVLKGKPVYMSPEQASQQKLDARSDVFSLGTVVYELLTGVQPFERDSSMASLAAVVHGDIVPMEEHRNDLPDDLVAAVMKALARDPDQRYRTAAEMGAALIEASPDDPEPIKDWIGRLAGRERVRERTRVVRVVTDARIKEGDEDEADEESTVTATSPPRVGTTLPGETSGEQTIGDLGGLTLHEGGHRTVGDRGLVGETLADGQTDPEHELGGPSLRIEPVPVVPFKFWKWDPRRLDKEGRVYLAAVVGSLIALMLILWKTSGDAENGATPTGSLEVNCIPWCQVYVDDEYLGLRDVWELDLAAGEYALRIEHPPSEAFIERRVLIEVGEKRLESFEFQQPEE